MGRIDETRPFLAVNIAVLTVSDTRTLETDTSGVTLAERLSAGPMSVAEALDVMAQVAAALAEVHALGIVHRDLKPANIMLTPDGLVKLLDLGLAESVADAGEQEREWARAGTPGWMSPEQISGGTVDARVLKGHHESENREPVHFRCPPES